MRPALFNRRWGDAEGHRAWHELIARVWGEEAAATLRAIEARLPPPSATRGLRTTDLRARIAAELAAPRRTT